MRSLACRLAAETALPVSIKPQLTKLVDQAPEGQEWLHELKYDGYRMHARLDRGAVRMLTRTGLDWTHKYPAIAAAVASLPARQAYLDGELCGVRPDGTTSFSLIQNASDTGNAEALISNANEANRVLSLAASALVANRKLLIYFNPKPAKPEPNRVR